MRIDWVIAIVTFIMFITWGFSYYSGISAGELITRSASALSSADSIIDYMMTDTLRTPANITSSYNVTALSIWAYMNWTDDMINSTKVFPVSNASDNLYCVINGNFLFWTTDLTTGNNEFFIMQSDIPISELVEGETCKSQPLVPHENQTTLGAAEPTRMFSTEMNSLACSEMNESYDDAKSSIGSLFDFNVFVDYGGNSTMECGQRIPAIRDVFAFQYSGRMYGGGFVNVTVRLWQ